MTRAAMEATDTRERDRRRERGRNQEQPLVVNLPGEIVGVDQPELNGVHQCLPRGFDDIAIDTNGGPDPVTVGGINEDANDCTRGCAAIDDTNFLCATKYLVQGSEFMVSGAVSGSTSKALDVTAEVFW